MSGAALLKPGIDYVLLLQFSGLGIGAPLLRRDQPRIVA